MRWNSHRRIARRICSDLYLEEDLCKVLESASLEPDRRRNFPHHTGKHRVIEEKIINARRKFINGDKVNAIRDLGEALHYIADKHSLPHSNPKHRVFEKAIEKLDITASPRVAPLDKFNTIRVATEPVDRKVLEDPQTALNTAYEKCLTVAASVLADPTPPPRYIEAYLKTKDNYLAERGKIEGVGVTITYFHTLSILLTLFILPASPLALLILPWLVILLIITVLTLYAYKKAHSILLKLTALIELRTAMPINIASLLFILFFMLPELPSVEPAIGGIPLGVAFYVTSFALIGTDAYMYVLLKQTLEKDFVENLEWYNWERIDFQFHSLDSPRENLINGIEEEIRSQPHHQNSEAWLKS